MLPRVPRVVPDVVAELPALTRYALSLTRDESDAEDLVHDALVKAEQARASFRPGANLRAWLMAIVHNTFVDDERARRARSRRHDNVRALTPSGMPPSQEMTVRLSQVQRAFFSLPDKQREALHLIGVEEMSYEDAARVLGIPVGTLLSRVSRARDRLRELEDGLVWARPHRLKASGSRGGTEDDD
jgi:RNA polymerase sigma-70 factor (ECF subfamily)